MDYSLNTMVEQLGFDNVEQVQALCNEHGGLPPGTALQDAEFWNRSQSAFMKEAIASDGPWALSVDQLDALLRG